MANSPDRRLGSGKEIKLTSFASCAGWAGKLDPQVLGGIIDDLSLQAGNKRHPGLIVGLQNPDDAAVMKIDEDKALVFSADFFAPVVDDAYLYGNVAAANALSDIYAMGVMLFLIT